jgi:hypothetical protein
VTDLDLALYIAYVRATTCERCGRRRSTSNGCPTRCKK